LGLGVNEGSRRLLVMKIATARAALDRGAPPSLLRLRPFIRDDETAILEAQRELSAEGFAFALDYEDGMRWQDYLDFLEHVRSGLDLAADRVPASMLAAEVSGQVVGRLSVRHTLNEFLACEGGHLGFAVRPQYRRNGYATEILRQGLIIARSLGVDRALVTCDEGNVGSATVIERCGGVFDSIRVTDEGKPIRRYWID
jgi:predicted acetyltransferase